MTRVRESSAASTSTSTRSTVNPTRAQTKAARDALKALDPESRKAMTDLFALLKDIGKEGDGQQELEAIRRLTSSATSSLDEIVVTPDEKLDNVGYHLDNYDKYRVSVDKDAGTGSLTFSTRDYGGCSSWKLTVAFKVEDEQVGVEFKARREYIDAYPSDITFADDERGAVASFLKELMGDDADSARAKRFLSLLTD